MNSIKVRYKNEKVLVDEFCQILNSKCNPWGIKNHITEFSYIRGRTDVVGLDIEGNIIAFELKLYKWYDAIFQAYKNTSFANISYVVLPEETAYKASQYCHEFNIRSIGLCFLKDGKICTLLPAIHQSPIQQWLNTKAVSKIIDKSNEQ